MAAHAEAKLVKHDAHEHRQHMFTNTTKLHADHRTSFYLHAQGRTAGHAVIMYHAFM